MGIYPAKYPEISRKMLENHRKTLKYRKKQRKKAQNYAKKHEIVRKNMKFRIQAVVIIIRQLGNPSPGFTLKPIAK